MAKTWTVASLVAAAIESADGKARVRITRDLPKEYLEARYAPTHKPSLDITLHYVIEGDPNTDGDIVTVGVAESLMRRQKALTPKTRK